MTPFVTEELWQRLYGSPGGPLIGAQWPELGAELIDAAAEDELDWLIRTVSALRAARSEVGIPPAVQLTLHVGGAAPETLERVARHDSALVRLARLAAIEPPPDPLPSGSLQVVVDEATMILPLAGVVDLDQERGRLDKALTKAMAEIQRFDQKLANQKFLDRAPPEVIEEQRTRRAEAEQTREKLTAALARIAS